MARLRYTPMYLVGRVGFEPTPFLMCEVYSPVPIRRLSSRPKLLAFVLLDRGTKVARLLHYHLRRCFTGSAILPQFSKVPISPIVTYNH